MFKTISRVFYDKKDMIIDYIFKIVIGFCVLWFFAVLYSIIKYYVYKT